MQNLSGSSTALTKVHYCLQVSLAPLCNKVLIERELRDHDDDMRAFRKIQPRNANPTADNTV